MFERDEIEMIADVIKKHNVLCISDEVYEWLIYPGNEQIRIGRNRQGLVTKNICYEPVIYFSNFLKIAHLLAYRLKYSIFKLNCRCNKFEFHFQVFFTIENLCDEGYWLAIRKVTQKNTHFKTLGLFYLPVSSDSAGNVGSYSDDKQRWKDFFCNRMEGKNICKS